MDENEFLAEQFEEHRAHLRAVAYRMLGSLSEADDAVQEAWLRLSRTDAERVENLGGWLTTVVARVCLNMLRSRSVAARGAARRPRCPSPIVSRADESRSRAGGAACRLRRARAARRARVAPARRAARVRAARHVRRPVRRDRRDRRTPPAAARQLASRVGVTLRAARAVGLRSVAFRRRVRRLLAVMARPAGPRRRVARRCRWCGCGGRGGACGGGSRAGSGWRVRSRRRARPAMMWCASSSRVAVQPGYWQCAVRLCSARCCG